MDRLMNINMKRRIIMEEREAVRVFKALGDEKRLRILSLLRQGERCACVLLEDLNLSQPTLSHHMKILCDARLVTGRKEGKWVYYSLNARQGEVLQQMVGDLMKPTGTSVADDTDRCC